MTRNESFDWSSITRHGRAPRIIYNDDNCSIACVAPPYTLDKVAQAVDYLANTQVDCLCWFVAAGVAYSYPSKVLDTLYDLSTKRDFGVGEPDKLPLHLHRQGIDYLPTLIDETRRRKIAFFASFRMNDAHHKSSPRGTLAPKFWQEHQDWRPWEVVDGYTYYNATLDYSHPEVRQRYFDAIVEVVNMYDVDGVELDFCRNPYLFPPSEAWGKRAILTGFIRQVRRALRSAGKQRGRPLGLIVRVPFPEQMRRNAGMDVPAWIRAGLMDALVMSNLVNNLNEIVEPWPDLCRKHGVLFYPSTEAGPAILKDRHGRVRVPNPLASAHNHVVLDETAEDVAARQRAMAQNYLAQGADGVYMFNYPCKLFEGANDRFAERGEFETKTAVLSQIGSGKTLRGLPKQFTFWEDLPLQIETARPPQYYQTIRFAVRDPDLGSPRTQVVLSYRQFTARNPHAPGIFEQDPLAPADDMICLLNGRPIKKSSIHRTEQPAGKISSGFTLPKHQLVTVTLPGRALAAGENMLAFHIPRFPEAKDPYIHIYQLTVDALPRRGGRR